MFTGLISATFCTFMASGVPCLIVSHEATGLYVYTVQYNVQKRTSMLKSGQKIIAGKLSTTRQDTQGYSWACP